MELRIIHREGHDKEVIVIPTRKKAIITGVIATPELLDIDGMGIIEKVGAGVLLHSISPEAVKQVEENPTEKLPEYLRPVEDRPHSIKIINGAKGTIYDSLDRYLEPVRPNALILNGFNEYDPHQ